jgi:hypothetical protein
MMDLENLKNKWQQNESKLSDSASVNREILLDIESQKLTTWLKPFHIKNYLVLVFNVLCIVALVAFIYTNFHNPPYVISAIVLLVYYIYLVNHSFQLIKSMKKYLSVADIISKQKYLAEINTQSLFFIRLSVLTIPVFLSFPVVVLKALNDLGINLFDGFDIIKHTNGRWWTVQIIVFCTMLPLGIWFYYQLSYKNMHKPWVTKLLNSTVNKKVKKSLSFMNELKNITDDKNI